MEDARFIIAGAGLGGLTAALGLAREGIASIVLEVAPELGEIGAGIQLGPNAFHVFDALGLGEQVRREAVFVDSFRLMDAAAGQRIAEFSLGESFRARFGNPYAVVHRADLHAALVERCLETGLVDLRTGHRVTGFSQAADRVEVQCQDRPAITGTALVGADGINSAIRAQLVADGPPRVAGHTTYRSVIPVEEMPEEFRWNAMTIWVGPRTHIVHYPLKGGKMVNLVATAHDDADTPRAGVPVSAAQVYAAFAHLSDRAQRVISRGTEWKLWVLCDRDPVERWTEGRVALLGDAAHPTLQYLAQGACMAMEDALFLSRAQREAKGDVARAFEAYRLARMDRTARVQLGSRLIGDNIFHPDGAQARIRNTIVGGMSDDAFYDFMRWLYDRDTVPGIAAPVAVEPQVAG